MLLTAACEQLHAHDRDSSTYDSCIAHRARYYGTGEQALHLRYIVELAEAWVRPTLLLLTQAKTGGGKTLAFLIPAIEMMIKGRFKPRNGAVHRICHAYIHIQAMCLLLAILTRSNANVGGRHRRYRDFSNSRTVAANVRRCP